MHYTYLYAKTSCNSMSMHSGHILCEILTGTCHYIRTSCTLLERGVAITPYLQLAIVRVLPIHRVLFWNTRGSTLKGVVATPHF